MNIDNLINKDKIAIIVVGYNRLKSIKRLLGSLVKAEYPSKYIPLVISIDCSEDEELYTYVRDFEWPYGEKYLIIQDKRLGLKEHILSCGDLSQYFRAIILLEDDLYVSKEFYNYIVATVDKYYNTEQIAGISLYRHEFNGFAGYPFAPLHNGSDVFAVQTVVSWGQCWTDIMWSSFRNWLSEHNRIDFPIYDMPSIIGTWEKAWSKYFYAYILETNKFFIIPYISLSTNFGDAGEHSDGCDVFWQVNLLNGSKNYNLSNFEELVKYDIYFNNLDLYKSLDLSQDVLCLDLFGDNNNKKDKRYWLSIQKLPYKVINSFGLILKPHELNIIYNIRGNNIFLYDTSIKRKIKKGDKYKIIQYHFNIYNKGDILKYLIYDFLKRINKKFK